MTVQDLAALPGIRAISIPQPQAPINAGFTSDLLSDVAANCPDDSVLITIQAHNNTIAVATLVGTAAIIICSGRAIPEDMQATALRENVALLATDLNQLDASHLVKSALIANGTEGAVHG